MVRPRAQLGLSPWHRHTSNQAAAPERPQRSVGGRGCASGRTPTVVHWCVALTTGSFAALVRPAPIQQRAGAQHGRLHDCVQRAGAARDVKRRGELDEVVPRVSAGPTHILADACTTAASSSAAASPRGQARAGVRGSVVPAPDAAPHVLLAWPPAACPVHAVRPVAVRALHQPGAPLGRLGGWRLAVPVAFEEQSAAATGRRGARNRRAHAVFAFVCVCLCFFICLNASAGPEASDGHI